MAGVDEFPELTTAYRASVSKSNKLSWIAVKNKLKSENTGDSKVDCHTHNLSSSQNFSSNPWGHTNVIQRLGAEWGNGGGSKVANRYKQKGKHSSLVGTGNVILNDSNVPRSLVSPTLEKGLSVGVDTTTIENCKTSQCNDDKKVDSESDLGLGVDSTKIENLNDSNLTQPVVSPTLEKGVSSSVGVDTTTIGNCEASDESDTVFDSDDDLSLDDTDSDTGEKNHEGRKKSRWLRNFFEKLDRLSIEEIHSQDRQWHCPACKGASGAIDWYKGLEPLLHHSKTIKTRRARLHRMLAETLEEECFRRKAPLSAASEVHGKWEGLDKKVKDHEIVWPPMVIIMNTKYEQDENGKWIGMGNKELLDSFSDYAALKARHSYGPQGHRGMGVLIFEASLSGYLEAARLHKHFKEQGRDREAWNHCKNSSVPGGKRQLYGYLASKEDLDIFNRHCEGNPKLKFEMRSYQEMVESKIKHINNDSQQIDNFKTMIAKEQIKSLVFANSLHAISEKLYLTTEDNPIVREHSKEQHLQNKMEMDVQEKTFLDQIEVIQRAIAAKKDKLVTLKLRRLEIAKKPCGESAEKYDDKVENMPSFLDPQNQERSEFETERANVLKIYEEKRLNMKRKLLGMWQELVEVEKELENNLTQLMDKYTSHAQEENCQK